MPSTGRPKQFQQRNLLARADVDALFPEPPPEEHEVGRVIEMPIDALDLDDQPRQIVPDHVLAGLIAEGRAKPAALLAELKAIAGQHPHYRRVLEALGDLAKTIEAEGVLEPLLVVEAGGRHIVRDGHRRTLASLLAGRATVPVLLMDEPTDVQAATRQLVVNIQRSDLTALEKGRWILRLAKLVERQLRAELGLDEAGSVVEALVSRGPGEEDGGEPQRGGSAAERDLAAQVRKRVCELTGLSQRHYYNLIYLNRLTPAARDAGIGLTEGQLRPVTSLPPADQAEIVAFIAQRNLTTREANTLVQVARAGDRDAVQRVMAKLAREDTGRQRAAVSWEALLHALPRDLWARCASLRAELSALPEELRSVRLRTMWEQRKLAEEFVRQFDDIFALYGYEGPATPEADAEGE